LEKSEGVRKTERDRAKRETEAVRDIQTEREREKKTQTETYRQKNTDRERDRKRHRQKHTDRERERERETERDRERQRETRAINRSPSKSWIMASLPSRRLPYIFSMMPGTQARAGVDSIRC
jgi:archaellum component FlaD/FlaE